METKWIWIGLAVWVFLLYTAYIKYRQQIAAVLSNQDVVKEISRKLLAGETDDAILSFMREHYKITGMAAGNSLNQIKKALAQRQAQREKK